MRTMTLYRPNAIQHAMSDFDRYFDNFVGDCLLTPTAKIFSHVPAVDIRETDKAYMVEMELPGYDEKNIEIQVDGSTLTIASKQETVSPSPKAPPAASPMGPKEEKVKEETSHTESSSSVAWTPLADSETHTESWLLKERHTREFSRSFKLPQNANPEEISAEFKNGVLSMAIQKRAEAQRRTVQIKAS